MNRWSDEYSHGCYVNTIYGCYHSHQYNYSVGNVISLIP